jgi:hypothetical protein
MSEKKLHYITDSELGRLRQWEDAYDRLLGAFELDLTMRDLRAAATDLVGTVYDMRLWDLAEQLKAQQESASVLAGMLAEADSARLDAEQRAADLQARLEAAEDAINVLRSILWMAERYAEGGGSHGIEMEDYRAAVDKLTEYDEARQRTNA